MELKTDRRIAVGICETQPLVAEGMRHVLAASGAYRLLEPVATLDDAARQILLLSPRVMFVDKGFGALQLLEWLAQNQGHSATAPVVWGNMLKESEALRLLKAGARGIMRKNASPERILACLDSVVNGATWMEESLFREIAQPERPAVPQLTAREQQVMELVEQGLRNKEIARELGIRPGTVKIHLKHIFEKTGIRGRYGLALSGLAARGTLPVMVV
jgi:two-component system nitrate/nitrite response regulator NarL